MLLKTGHALLNDEAGQTESATVSVQCFYAGDDLIGRMCSLLPRVNGTGETAWLRYNAASHAAPSALPHGEATFGDSVFLHKDRAASDADSLKDDGLVSFTPNGTHILCTGSDLRVPASVLCAATRGLRNRKGFRCMFSAQKVSRYCGFSRKPPRSIPRLPHREKRFPVSFGKVKIRTPSAMFWR